MTPQAPAATVNRPWSSEYIATLKPSPSLPIRLSAGTSTFVEEELAGGASPDAELVPCVARV